MYDRTPTPIVESRHASPSTSGAPYRSDGSLFLAGWYGISRTVSCYHCGQLLTLPNETLVFPAHDYKGDTVSTIGEIRPGGLLHELVAVTGKRILFYCAFGERSAMAVGFARDVGIDACHIVGGIDAWKKDFIDTRRRSGV